MSLSFLPWNSMELVVLLASGFALDQTTNNVLCVRQYLAVETDFYRDLWVFVLKCRDTRNMFFFSQLFRPKVRLIQLFYCIRTHTAHLYVSVIPCKMCDWGGFLPIFVVATWGFNYALKFYICRLAQNWWILLPLLICQVVTTRCCVGLCICACVVKFIHVLFYANRLPVNLLVCVFYYSCSCKSKCFFVF